MWLKLIKLQAINLSVFTDYRTKKGAPEKPNINYEHNS
jgi:hypothetical protein